MPYSCIMLDLVIAYWPHILAALSILMGTVAAVHATMTKEEVRSALGWVGVIVLSPIVGAVIYAIAGINRIAGPVSGSSGLSCRTRSWIAWRAWMRAAR